MVFYTILNLINLLNYCDFIRFQFDRVSFYIGFSPFNMFISGRAAIREYNLLPFVDTSCQRELEFSIGDVSIAAFCRGTKFAPILKVGDQVIYLTKTGRYKPLEVPHTLLAAILEVVRRFDSHEEAAGVVCGRKAGDSE